MISAACRLWRVFLVVVGLVGLVGCGNNGTSASSGCIDHGECPLGMGCVAGECAEVGCLQSTDCPFGARCDEDSYTCVEGCGTDADCDAGESCDTTANACVTNECRDTWLDCNYGEVCEAGACVAFDGPFCTPCPDGQDASCGEGAVCHWFDKEKDYYCLPDCDASDNPSTCPYPAECRLKDRNVNFVGYCHAECAALVDGGLL